MAPSLCVRLRQKNRELTQTGPYAYTRNPLYLGSILFAAGFAVALLSWPVAAMLAAVMFLIILCAGHRLRGVFLRTTFQDFGDYCRPGPATHPSSHSGIPSIPALTEVSSGKFSVDLYLRHREYNSLIGAALLYLSLFFLRPLLGLFLKVPR